MVCPNCKSTDIITVQDEYFCITCGQIVPRPTKPVAPSKAPATTNQVAATELPAGVQIIPVPGVTPPTIKPEPARAALPDADAAKTPPAPTIASSILKRRKPGRPKAGRLDVPDSIPGVDAPLPVTTEPTAAPVTSAVAPVSPAIARFAPHPSSPSTPAIPSPTPASPQRRLNDIMPVATLNIEPDGSPAKSKSDKPAAPALSFPGAPHLRATVLASASLHERIRPAVFGWSLLPAAFLALLIGGATLVLVRSHLDTVLAATRHAGSAVWGEILIVLALYYLSHSLVSGAITFGIARRSDHRPVSLGRQFAVAVNSLGVRLRFDILTTALQLVLLALIVSLVFTGSARWPIPEIAQLAGLFITFLILAYLLAGITLMQGLGRVGLTLATINARRSFSLSWNLFRRHFELVGFRILGLILELLLLVPFAGAATALIIYVPAQFNWVVALGITILAAVSGALIGAGTAAWWETAYRHLIKRDHLSEAVTLLSSRSSTRPQRVALTITAIIASLLILTAIAWSWLPIHS